MEDIKTGIRELDGHLQYFLNGKRITKLDYDLNRYYDTMCKRNWDDIMDAVKDYRLSREWN